MAYLYMDSIWSQTRLKSKWQSRLCHWSQWPITSSFRNCELITKNLAWVSDSIWSIWSANCSYLWSNREYQDHFLLFKSNVIRPVLCGTSKVWTLPCPILSISIVYLTVCSLTVPERSSNKYAERLKGRINSHSTHSKVLD